MKSVDVTGERPPGKIITAAVLGLLSVTGVTIAASVWRSLQSFEWTGVNVPVDALVGAAVDVVAFFFIWAITSGLIYAALYGTSRRRPAENGGEMS